MRKSTNPDTLANRRDVRQMIAEMRHYGWNLKRIAKQLHVPFGTVACWSAGLCTPQHEKTRNALTDLWAEITE